MPTTLLALQRCLDQEIGLVQDFIEILKAEEHVLTDAGNNDGLSATTERKNICADQLAAVAEQRERLLMLLGYNADLAGLDAAAEQHTALLAPKTALLKYAQQASELNASNGIIINTFLAHNQNTLDTLRRLAGIGGLYDASGRSQTGGKGSIKKIKAG
ncbi:MAG TPA: flagellar protein FlgN [Candidimonas sp.]|nr:flagellar protein FlgN [Candidimonas sp.]